MTATARGPRRPDAARVRGPQRPDAAAVSEALIRGDCGEMHGDTGCRAQYTADASNYRRVPLAVVFPRERRTCSTRSPSAAAWARRSPRAARAPAPRGRPSAPAWSWTSPATSTSHAHCHQHATSGFTADSALLDAMGVDNGVLNSGCCGPAGNFGFERGHYDVSVVAGEQVLLPAVRAAAPDTVVLADGFSWRTQITQRTDRAGTHLAELIARALPHQASSSADKEPAP
ncbi:hypothetical protein [Streptomyces sp. NPDC059455]|uniref:hypothetical protein n=1 Tax=Streptomyces sp. NPDC059455 TaxID=3346837 RepID=UPI00368FB545